MIPLLLHSVSALALSGLLLQAAPEHAQSTTLIGQVLDQTTQAPVAYASVGVLRRPVGTVADDQGRFTLKLPAANDQDSLRIGLLGYAPRTMQMAAQRQLGRSSWAAAAAASTCCRRPCSWLKWWYAPAS